MSATSASATSPAAPGWRRPRITLSFCLEITGRWWLITICGLLLLSAVLLSLQRTQVQMMREARLEIALQGLRERMETSLSLGFDLADSEHAQALLEDLLADDPSLLSAEVFDISAISLFNTDRGAIGEMVPTTWLTASVLNHALPMTSGHTDGSTGTWTVTGQDSFTLGLPIRGPFGEIAGQVTITSSLPPTPEAKPLILASGAAVILMTAVGAFLTVWLLRALGKQRDHAAMELAEIRLREAEKRLADALSELKRNEVSV